VTSADTAQKGLGDQVLIFIGVRCRIQRMPMGSVQVLPGSPAGQPYPRAPLRLNAAQRQQSTRVFSNVTNPYGWYVQQDCTSPEINWSGCLSPVNCRPEEVMALDDLQLVELARGGSQDAWSELVRRHHHTLEVVARLRLGSDRNDTGRDVVQQVWLQFFEWLAAGRPVQDVRNLLITMVRRRCIDEIRRRCRNREVVFLDEPIHLCQSDTHPVTHAERIADQTALDQIIEAEGWEAIEEALGCLSERDRALVLAWAVEGRSMKECARLMVERGLTTDTGHTVKRVENYYYRALAKLRDYLGPVLAA
jgi:RNA polymerase sigma factor (sigma-70 family)